MRSIYLDNAATTPLYSKVIKAMSPYFLDKFGNPSSSHKFGNDAKIALNNARDKVGLFLGCEAEEIIFTSSATEANNLAILGFCRRAKKIMPDKKLNIIVSAIEHDAVLKPARELEREGFELRIIKPNSEGFILARDVENKIDENTILVSVMYVNNETGVIQPILEIAELIRKIRRINDSALPMFHSDAVQAANFLDCKIENLGVDFLTLSSHKIYGPKGAGILYMRKKLSVDPIIFGGGQEFRFRSGTENIPAIIGFSEAISLIDRKNNKKIEELRDYLEKKVLESILGVMVVGKEANRLPNISCFLFEGIEGEGIALSLSEKGIFVSTGSACSSNSLSPSHVLISMGFSHEEAHGSIRFSLGSYNTKGEINTAVRILKKVVKKLRKISPLYNKA